MDKLKQAKGINVIIEDLYKDSKRVEEYSTKIGYDLINRLEELKELVYKDIED